MTTWRHYARREYPRVVLELGLVCATKTHDHDLCPVHHDAVNPTTRLCETCFQLAWEEVGRRYVEQGRPAQLQPERRAP